MGCVGIVNICFHMLSACTAERLVWSGYKADLEPYLINMFDGFKREHCNVLVCNLEVEWKVCYWVAYGFHVTCTVGMVFGATNLSNWWLYWTDDIRLVSAMNRLLKWFGHPMNCGVCIAMQYDNNGLEASFVSSLLGLNGEDRAGYCIDAVIRPEDEGNWFAMLWKFARNVGNNSPNMDGVGNTAMTYLGYGSIGLDGLMPSWHNFLSAVAESILSFFSCSFHADWTSFRPWLVY